MMRILMAVLVLMLVALQFQLWQERAQLQSLDERLSAQTQANIELKARNDALFAEVQDLREGLDAIEERARAELGLVGENESFYLIVDPALVEADAVEPEPEPARPIGEPSRAPTPEDSSDQAPKR